MSWSTSGTASVRRKSGGDGVGVVMGFADASPQNGHGEEESKKAIAAAQDAACKLLETGAFGTGTFAVSLSGHANPDNKPAAGWSNEFVSININQRGE